MEKYGIIISVAEEFLRTFLSDSVISHTDVLSSVAKDIILHNWNIPRIYWTEVECRTQYDIRTDRYLFRLGSGKPISGFIYVSEGMECPQKDWFLKE